MAPRTPLSRDEYVSGEEYWGDDYQRAPSRRRPRRRRSRLRRLAAVLGTLVIVLLLAFAALWVATPGVGDAPKRTAALLREHDAPSLDGAVPDRVAAALIATEDARFYSHSGLDARGALRGALSLSRGGALGGATIDAQLAKLLYTHGAPGVKPATKQVVLAVKLDNAYTKRQILSMYFDAAYFGHGAYGLVSASRTYFGVAPSQLTWAQATMLAGLVNAPSAYDPTEHYTLARERQRHVLDRMVATKAFTRAQADQVFAAPLNPVTPFSG
jgi:membrane peptidoglycan carboxypeptidase